MAHRHKRETDARRKTLAALVAAPLVLLATGTAVAVGVTTQHQAPVHDVIRSEGDTTPSPRSTEVASRSESRMSEARGARYLQHLQDAYDAQQTQRAIHRAHEHLWTTAPLNLWSGSEQDATQVGLVDQGEKVLTTGRRSGGRAELVVDGKARWVTATYLSQQPPAPPEPPKPSGSPSDSPSTSPSPTPSETPSSTPAQPATSGLSTAPCPDGSVENGLVPDAVLVYRAVCHAFPQIDTYLGYDAHGEHASGKAIDIMTSDKALGDQIAAFLQAHASELNLYDVIWWDRIWTPVRASEGWRDYGDHGSPTANHMDHVHVSTN